MSHSNCKAKYGSIIDSSAHLCAGAGHAAASGGCNGDSGGPLACEIGGRWYLHGAVSFGRRYCPTTHYTVFARITSYRTWILQKIGAHFFNLILKLTNVLENKFKKAVSYERNVSINSGMLIKLFTVEGGLPHSRFWFCVCSYYSL